MIRTSWLWLIINFFDHFAIYIHETLSEFYIRNTIFRLDMNSPLVPLRSICINRRTTSVSCTGSLDLVTWINLLFIHKCVYSGEACDRPRKCYKSGTTVCVTWSGVTRDQTQVTAPSQGNENVQEESKENRQACETRLNRNRCLYSWS